MKYVITVYLKPLYLQHVKGCVNTIAFNESGNLLVSGSDDATIKIWDVYRGECLKTLKYGIQKTFKTTFLTNNLEGISPMCLLQLFCRVTSM